MRSLLNPCESDPFDDTPLEDEVNHHDRNDGQRAHCHDDVPLQTTVVRGRKHRDTYRQSPHRFGTNDDDWPEVGIPVTKERQDTKSGECGLDLREDDSNVDPKLGHTVNTS